MMVFEGKRVVWILLLLLREGTRTHAGGDADAPLWYGRVFAFVDFITSG
jgi:hypothetical protein